MSVETAGPTLAARVLGRRALDTMRTGVDPNGHQMSEQMPWRPLGQMDDEELIAVYEYLTHLPGS